mmetsp:Transcript_2839/g.4299  ORF Transcript_2839/g.4299 Transcript_2839/m.4299 type:complete len:235 (-) Transcript_2839:108-812(-)
MVPAARQLNLVVFREKDGTDRRQELLVYKLQTGGHGVVANNLSCDGSKTDSPVSGIGKVLGLIVVEGNVGGKLNSALPLHDLHVFGNRVWQDLGDGGGVIRTAVDDNVILLDLDEPLYDELLEELGVVLAAGEDAQLGGGIGKKLLKELVAHPHLLHIAFSDLGRASNALLHLAVLLLLGEFFLNGELCLVDEGLLLKVEIVLGLDTDFVCLLVCLLKDEVYHLTDLIGCHCAV